MPRCRFPRILVALLGVGGAGCSQTDVAQVARIEAHVVAGFFSTGGSPPGFKPLRARVTDVATGLPITDATVEANQLGITYDQRHGQYEGGLPDGLAADGFAQISVSISAHGTGVSGTASGYAGPCTIDVPPVLHRGFPQLVHWTWADPLPGPTGIALLDPADINGPFLWPSVGTANPFVGYSFQGPEPGYQPFTEYGQPRQPVARWNLLVPSSAPDRVLLVAEGGFAAAPLGDAGRSDLGIARLCAQEIQMSTAPLVSLSLAGPTEMPDPTDFPHYPTAGQFQVTGHFDDGNEQDLTEGVTWSAAPEQVVQIAADGSFSIVGRGTTQITASYGGVSGSMTFVVTEPEVQSIAVVSQDLTNGRSPVYPGQFQIPYGLNALFDAGNRNVAAEATWSSSNPAVASVDSAGLVTTGAPGSAEISASFGGLTASSSLRVIDWRWQRTTGQGPLRDLVWTGTQFVAVGDNVALTSPDGVQWARHELPSGGGTIQLVAVCWTGNQLVAVGNREILTSPDGATWTSRTLPARTDGVVYTLLSVAGSSSSVVATGNGVVLTSADGASWEVAVTWLAGTRVLWTGSVFLVVDPRLIATSVDGIRWTPEQSPGLSTLTLVGPEIVSVGSGQLLRSPDGVSWTAMPIDPSVDPAGLVWTGTELLGQDAQRTVFTSPDGVSWTRQQLALGLLAVASSPDREVVLLDDGNVMTRP